MKKFIKFIPNGITITRIILSVLFISDILGQFVYRKKTFYDLILIFTTICVSDLLDGKLARKIGCTSVIGAKLDVFADLFFIVLSSLTLIILKILPLWLLVFIGLKFLEFIITSNFINKYNNNLKKAFVFDRVGRIVPAMFFIIPGIACIFHVLLSDSAVFIINLILYFMLAGGIYSSYLRIVSCIKLSFKASIYEN